MNALILGMFWMAYYTVHSLMATVRFKKFIRRSFSAFYPYYRLVYSLFASVNFLLLLHFHTIVHSELIFYLPQLIPVGYGLCLCAAVVLAIALKSYGAAFFFKEADSKKLQRSGLNAYVRHPLYFGVLLFLVGFFMVSPNWKNLFFGIVSGLYLVVGTLLEERKLIDEYGHEYIKYRQEVKMLIPWLF